jgi:hypothetical protein
MSRGMAQAVDCLLCKYKALSSNLNFTKKKNKKYSRVWWFMPVILDTREVKAGRS